MRANSLTISKAGEKGSVTVASFLRDRSVTTPHRHNNYLELIFLSSGDGYHTIDDETYEIKTPVVFVVRREQVHHWNIQSDPQGYVILLRESFLDQSVDIALRELLMKVMQISAVAIENAIIMHQILGLLEHETSQSEITIASVEGLLKAFLSILLRGANISLASGGSSANLYQNFRELIISQKNIRNNVSYYASLLNTTPQSLNAVCRKYANETASAVLGMFIITEAKRLLAYSNMQIIEIAWELGFHDGSHFIKYFKKHTGKTPNNYRVGK